MNHVTENFLPSQDVSDQSDTESVFSTSKGQREAIWEDEWPLNDNIYSFTQKNCSGDSKRIALEMYSTYEQLPFSSPFSPPSSCPSSPLSNMPLNSDTPHLNIHSASNHFLLRTVDFGQLSECTDASNEKWDPVKTKCTHEKYVNLLIELKLEKEKSSSLQLQNMELIATAAQIQIFHDIVIKEYQRQIEELMRFAAKENFTSFTKKNIIDEGGKCHIPYSYSPIPSIISISSPDLQIKNWTEGLTRNTVSCLDFKSNKYERRDANGSVSSAAYGSYIHNGSCSTESDKNNSEYGNSTYIGIFGNIFCDRKMSRNKIESIPVIKENIQSHKLLNVHSNFDNNEGIEESEKGLLSDFYTTINLLMSKIEEYKNELLDMEEGKSDIMENNKISAGKTQIDLRNIIADMEGKLALLNFETEEYKIELLSQQKCLEGLSALYAVEPS